MIKNRIEKNFKKLGNWAQRNKIEAYRIYDRDIPEYPFIVDRYKNYFVIYDRSDAFIDKDKNHLEQLITAIKDLFQLTDDLIILKKRERQEGLKQYEKLNNEQSYFNIQESQALFKVNLTDYLDTGLFLDHRPMRYKIFKSSHNKRFLNLFCYTGSVSVFAALGGAHTTSVDMSQTYIQWAQDNFKLNQLNPSHHEFINANVMEWLKEQSNLKYDIIFLDPPTFSNSKKMDQDFEVERDQEFLVHHCMKLLNPSGVLYFSNNKRKFKLSEALSKKYAIKDITEDSIPIDFHDKKIHHCFEIR